MLVYGDRAYQVLPAEVLNTAASELVRLRQMPPGLARHSAAVSLFIDIAGLAQGLADEEFATLGLDAPSARQTAAAELLTRLAGWIGSSWASGFAPAEPPKLAAKLAELASMELPASVVCREPEGYAFYAVYPESYFMAARALGARPAMTVVGIRSIGLGLAAMVSASLSARPPLSVRPIGPPFERQLAPGPELSRRLGEAREIAVVDEGPGLSGSSFMAVADAVSPSAKVYFFPSHTGPPGPRAGPRRLARWAGIQRHVVDFDALIGNRLGDWVSNVVGRSREPLIDISGGKWRGVGVAGWPPAVPRLERRKFLAQGEHGDFLVKFAGLGQIADRKLHRARQLHEAGFVAEPMGLCHGFLVERWVEHAPWTRRWDEDEIVARVGGYLAFRARSFPAETPGASLAELAKMARTNIGEGLNADAASGLERWDELLPHLQSYCRPVETDNRLHAWEWLRTSDGRLLKADALDHHRAHDLVGAQDIAWDIAGAIVEFDLSLDAAERLTASIAQNAGAKTPPPLLRFLELCYLAFQLGAFTMAAEVVGDPKERQRLEIELDRYRRRLVRTVSL